MSPPNQVDSVHEIQPFPDIRSLKRSEPGQGVYPTYPKTKYPPLDVIDVVDKGLKADPQKRSLFGAATKVIDLTPNIGTEIVGVQLSQLTDEQKDELALLAAERGVVFFRDQDINIHQQLDLGRYWGRLHIHPTGGNPEGFPEVLTIFSDSLSRKQYGKYRKLDGYHTDVSYEKQPPGLTSLKLDTIPDVGGDTLWASGYGAYDTLSAPWKEFIEGLTAVHSAVAQYEGSKNAGGPTRREPVETEHPIVRVHPVTGWKSLFVNRGFTRYIPQLTRGESDVVLNYLYDHIARGVQNQVRFSWTPNAVALWDNRIVVHSAIQDYGEELRHGLRVTPQAETPYYDPNGKSRAEVIAARKAAAATA